jgi:hypothetical protein
MKKMVGGFGLGLALWACLCAPSRAGIQEEFADALAPAKGVHEPHDLPRAGVVDLARMKKFGPYMLVTHSGALYPEAPFILVLKKNTEKDPKALKAAIAKRLKSKGFDDAVIVPAEEFYPWLLEQHPEQAVRLKREQAQTMVDLQKGKIAAYVFRVGRDNSESVRRP